jgi:tetratricopeptide (TPR) repeat protein
MLMGRFDDGYQFIQKSVDIDPEIRTPKAAMTHWLTNYGRLVEAVQNGQRLLRDSPDFALNVTTLITAYVTIGLTDDAKAVLENALEAFPDNSQVQSTQVGFWLVTRDFDSFNEYAAEQFQTIDQNVGDPLSRGEVAHVYRYGRSMLIKGNNERAAELLNWAAGGEEGIESKTYDEIAKLKMLALAYRRLGRDEEADALLSKCLNLVEGARENGWATPALFVRLAETYVLLGDVENAIENLDLAFEKGWRDLNVIDYGMYWEGLQDHPELNRIKLLLLNDLESQRLELREGIVTDL